MNTELPGFVWDFKDDAFTKRIDSVRDFYDKKGFFPRRNHSEADESERKLGKVLSHLREEFNKGLSDDRLQYVQETIPEF